MNMLQQALARLMRRSVSSAASSAPAKARRGTYNFLPHSSKRSRIRQLRQTYRGQLPMAQFQNATQYHGAKMVYLDLVSRGAA